MPRILVCLFLIVPGVASAQQLRADFDATIRALEPRVIEWRRDLHRHPELSNRNHSPFFNVSEKALLVGVRALVGMATEDAERAAGD